VNQIIHHSNDRLERDLDTCIRHKVPIIITSLRAPDDIVKKVHAYGGLVFHDVISIRHAEKALEAGVDGLILVCAGAGGHAGALSPFALLREVRRFYFGPIALSGSITDGAGILAAEAMGADFAYIGTRFIATREANAVDLYKQTILESSAADVVYTPFFTGVHGNYLKASIMRAGLDPDNLAPPEKTSMSFASDRAAKAWKDIWGVGQGVGNISDVPPTAELISRLKKEYDAARVRLRLAQ
jgi:nitronate monooxygenase